MKILKWVGIAFVVLLVIGVIGSMMSPEGREGMRAGADAALGTEEPTPTLEPATPEPETPEPATPEPTPDPTPEPTVNEGAIGLAEFSSYVLAQNDEFLAHLSDVTEAAGSNDLQIVFDEALEFWSDLGTWSLELAAMQPHECYADLHASYSTVVDTYYESMDLITDAIIYEDLDMMDEGIELMNVGVEQIGETTTQIEQADCS